jgi:hypothetical protein
MKRLRPYLAAICVAAACVSAVVVLDWYDLLSRWILPKTVRIRGTSPGG